MIGELGDQNNEEGKVEYLPLFPSFTFRVDTNPEFKDYIRDDLIQFAYKERENDSEGVAISNNGGWHSHTKLRDQENFEKYKDFIYKYVRKAFTKFMRNGGGIVMKGCWININGGGDSNHYHCHPGAHMSGVLWVKSSEKSGSLRFVSPHEYDHHHLLTTTKKEAKSKHFLSHAYYMTPEEGCMVIFPSSLVHHVLPNENDVDRISIAFNLTLNI